MKRFLKHVALFSSFLVIVVVVMEIMLRQIPNPHAFKRGLIESKGKDVKNLIIGSSVSNCGIDPNYMADSTLNLSVSAQWIRYNQKVLEKYIDQMPHLKNVIWGLCYHSLWVDDKEEVDKGDVVYHHIYWDIYNEEITPPHSLSKILYNSELLSTGSVACKKWMKYYIQHRMTMMCDSSGLDNGFSLENRNSIWKERLLRKVKEHTVRDTEESRKMFRENLLRMHQVAQLCEERGVSLHLVLCPLYEDYYERADKRQVAKLREAVQDVAAHNGGVYVYDYLCDGHFEEDDFFDGNHLTSDGGSKKFAKILWHDMQQNLSRQGD